ncbi:methionine--tRNA ligase [bacterium]|nr:methionine--tRNA ligase [bacterium]|tara:strand:+ start:23113 stop:24534 length:1422 start_codon:yes stop_codon:yes gene_type:complete
MKESFYITTTLPYVNADPHVGFALELVQADVIARYQKLKGREVFFNTGTDEHGIKIFRNAGEMGMEPIKYADQYSERFQALTQELGITEHNFVRTTSEDHKKAAQAFWKKCEEKGDIYKKNYKVKYCVGCELEKTDSELTDGKCPLHPNVDIEVIEEENYFFKFSNYQDKLLELYKNNPEFVLPGARMNEITSFVERGLQDFSISRLKEKMPWGVEVPGDPEHVMYVWFDALSNYISVIGWPEKEEEFKKWWPGVQVAGKDNLRQQSAMWQAMLMSAGLPSSKKILIHGFINSGGQKMSKSLGNVIDPREIIKEYGADALRYYLVREVNTFEDSDMTMERFKEAYNANLANGLGNLTARIMKLAETHLEKPVECKKSQIDPGILGELDLFEIQKVADLLWEHIGHVDVLIQKEKPFEVIKTEKEKGIETIKILVEKLNVIAINLEPFMPETSKKIKMAIKENKMPEPLFKRLD